MKYRLLLFGALLFCLLSSAQRFKTGTYIFKYCDLEYNMCLGPCKVVIKGDRITVYATKELAKNRSYTKEGDIIDRGIIVKHKSGKWIIGKSYKDKYVDDFGDEDRPIIDFKKRQYWTF